MADTALRHPTVPRGERHSVGSTYRVRIGRKGAGMTAILLLALVALLCTAPAIAPRPLLQNLVLVFLLASLAQFWNLLAGYAGLVSVGQQAFVGLGGYLLFALVAFLEMDPLAAALLSGAGVAVVATLVGIAVFRLKGPYFAVTTWVVAEVFRLLVSQVKELGGGSGTALPRQATNAMLGIEPTMALFGVRTAAAREIVIYWSALGLAVAATAVAYALLRSRLGLALSAIRDEEVAAESVGVGSLRVKFQVYLLTAFGTGVTGALIFIQKGRISPDAAFSVLDWTAYVIFIVVIGGIGTLEGPIIGAVIFVLLQYYFSDFGAWYLIGLGSFGILVILVAPKGLWGSLSSRLDFQLFPTRRHLVVLDGGTPRRGA